MTTAQEQIYIDYYAKHHAEGWSDQQIYDGLVAAGYTVSQNAFYYAAVSAGNTSPDAIKTSPPPKPTDTSGAGTSPAKLDQEMLAFFSGELPRGEISADEWQKMLTYAEKRTGQPATTQPATLFRDALQQDGLDKAYKKNFSDGIARGVWEKDKTSQYGYVYSTSYSGQPGEGASGSSASGVPPVPPPGAAGGADQTKNNMASFSMLLSSWGLNPADYKGLLQKAASGGWNQDRFTQAVADTKAFHEAFPGIFDKNGNLTMDPGAYITQKNAYMDTAEQAGINLGDNKLAYLFKNQVSSAEFADRAKAITSLRTNQAYFDAFNEERKREGLQPLTKGEQFKMVMGEGNQQWYDQWQATTTRYSAEQAGLAFGKAAQAYTNLGQNIVKKVSGLGLSQSEMQQGFQSLAQQLTSTLPMSKIQKFNISKQDLVELQFGGPRQAAIAQRVAQVLANEKMATQARAANVSAAIGSRTEQGMQQTAGGG